MNPHKSLLLLLAAASLMACSSNKSTETAETEEVIPENIVEMRADQIKLAGIETAAPETRPMSGSLKVSGTVTVAPNSLATVCAPLGGYIRSSNLLPGKPVRKGQTLALLENPEFIDLQQGYLEAKSQMGLAETEFRRQTDLLKNEATSPKNQQQASTEYAILKTKVRALEQKLQLAGINPFRLTSENLSRTVALKAPISGYLKATHVSIGQAVTSTDVLFEIVNCDQLFLELRLFEKDADQVSIGQELHFFINNESEQHHAVVNQTARTVDADKVYKVYATVQGYCANLMPGMYVNALIRTAGRKALTVPSAAVVRFEEKDYIFAFDKNKTEDGKPFTEYRIIPVTKGLVDGDRTEIALPADIQPEGLKVVVKGAYNLLSAKKNAGEMAC